MLVVDLYTGNGYPSRRLECRSSQTKDLASARWRASRKPATVGSSTSGQPSSSATGIIACATSAFISPKDMQKKKLSPGDFIRLKTRRGAIEVKVRAPN